ncbi:MAG: hypothetical protein SOU18_08925 [Alloprevotella sp.]|nr:hypothetical protein [Alloprevotella sp.]
MKIIKPIALKEAKILSNEEMKHLFDICKQPFMARAFPEYERKRIAP